MKQNTGHAKTLFDLLRHRVRVPTWHFHARCGRTVFVRPCRATSESTFRRRYLGGMGDFGAACYYLDGVVNCTVEGAGVGARRTLTSADSLPPCLHPPQLQIIVANLPQK